MNTETHKNTFSDNLLPTAKAETRSSHSLQLQPALVTPSAPCVSAAPLSLAPADSAQPAKPPPFSAFAPDNLDAITESRIDSLARRQRADSFLRSLTREQSRQVYKWISELDDINEVHSRITAPPPDGLGLTVSTITLRRLRSYWQALAETDFTRDMLDTITDMELDSELTQPARIQNAICHLLQGKAFDLARTVPGSPVMKDLLAGIEKLSMLDLKRQKLLLERERLLRPAPAPARTEQHHRVDLNIVPPKRDPAIVVFADPKPSDNAPQLQEHSND